MTLQSMTGFGRQETTIGEASLAVELKSVNNKQLKLTLRCPSWLSYLEPSLESAVKATFRRGTIYLNLNFERSESSAIQVNHERLEALMRAFSARGLNNQPLCLVPGVVEENQRQGLTEEEESLLLEGVRAAIQDLEKARMREGAAVQEVLVEMLKKLDEERVGIENHYVDHRREAEEKLKSRLEELSERDGAIGATDPLLLSREIALHVDRVDIREELDRLKLHFSEAIKIILEGEGPRGRKLEFMAQEIGREINTTGSKSQYFPISKAVIEMKTLLSSSKSRLRISSKKTGLRVDPLF